MQRRNPFYSHTQSNDSRLLGDQRRWLDAAELGSAVIDNTSLLGGRWCDVSEPDGR